MEKKLESYIKVYDNWLDDSVCDLTVKELSNCNWQQHVFHYADSGEMKTRSGEQELDVSWDNISTKKQIMQRIWDGYYRYIVELNFSWFDCWQGFTDVRFNRYLENRIMANHCDHIHTAFDGTRRGIPILTSLGSLNDDYEGGEFVMFGNEKIEIKKGTIIIFPSVFLYPHRVEPVTKGIRYSYVTWAW